MAMFKVKTPGNASDFSKHFNEMVSFELIDTTELNEEYMYTPEVDPLSLNLQEQGFESTLIVPNLGIIYYMLLGFFALAVLHLLLNLVGKKIPKVHRASSKISTFLYWNGIIRYFI